MLTRRDAAKLMMAAGTLTSAPATHALAQNQSTPAGSAGEVTAAEAAEIAREAYIFLYPLVTMEVTRKISTNVPAGVRTGLGPMNMFHHMRAYPPADFKEVVRPNFDTLYSPAWLDLTREPLIVSVPDTQGRYYLMPMIDMWSDVFAVPGKRTSGTKAAAYALTPNGWRGTLPKGVARIDAPTPYVWIIGRTQTNGPKDYDAVHKVQDAYTITPLSQWGRKAAPPPKFTPDPTVDLKTPPLDQVNKMGAGDFFRFAAALMKSNSPHVTDWSTMERIRRIGIEPGRYDPSRLSAAARAAIDAAPAESLKQIERAIPGIARAVNGWQMNTDTMGVYGNSYLKRAIVAMTGLGANQPQDAVYPLLLADADGQPVTGENRYVLHFEKAELPPANAFWSVTMYDEPGFAVPNAINRFAIGDRDDLKYNADGSLDLYIQSQSPGAALESNWLPAAASGKLGITMRLYAPRDVALNGTWNPPPVRKRAMS